MRRRPQSCSAVAVTIPVTVARGWTGLWGKLSGRPLPERLPACAQRVLAALSCELIDDEAIDPSWQRTLADPPRDGPVRPAVADVVRRAGVEWAI
jgi:hypothetical protein